ncbi:MAG: serine hydrolase [Candidatus Aminicenantes bacterium]|nr:MAG: serine hydrolase [Candidatus Aminicenantes bacterium]
MGIKTFAREIFLVCFILVFVVSCNGSVPDTDKAQRIDEFLRLCHEYRIFDGAVLVSESGKVIYKKSFGSANREWNVPNGLDSKFVIGSVSKQFTAMLILQLTEQDKLRLDGKISDYLPDFPKDKGNRVTIHQLLCHSSGIPNNLHFENWYTELWLKEYSTQELVELFYGLDLEFHPGSQFAYSNTGYYICAAIIEKVTGKKFEDVLMDGILKPLGMENSGFMDSTRVIPKMTTGCMYWNFAYIKPPYANPSSSKGAGSIYSTVEDLFKWVRGLAEQKLVSKKYQDLMFAPHINMRRTTGYGYGVVLGEEWIAGLDEAVSFAEHTGNQPGFSCLLFQIPDDDHSIIVLSNIDHIDLRLMKRGLVAILYGQQADVGKPISLVLVECETADEIQEAIDSYRKSNALYSIRRDAVNGLGFQFLHDKKGDMGLAVLEFNASEHPRSPWVFESLAEGYLMIGNTEKAIGNLNKLLELDPDNTSARKKLEELSRKK